MSCQFSVFPLGPGLGLVLCYIDPCMFCVALSMDLLVLCVACLTCDSVCKLFVETIRNMFGCGSYFVVECYGVV